MKHLPQICIALAMCIAFVRDSPADEVEQRLDSAIKAYDSKVSVAREPVLSQLRRARTAAQKDGDLQQLKLLDSEIKQFQAHGVKPPSVNGRIFDKYVRQITRLNADLESAYVSAIKQYTKSNDIASAEAIQKELDSFQENGRVNSNNYLPTGIWVANYSPGKCIATTQITEDMKAIFKDNLGRSRIGRVSAEKGQLTIQYADFVEVWMIDAEKKEISVGHYHPKSRFPTEKPSHTAKLTAASTVNRE